MRVCWLGKGYVGCHVYRFATVGVHGVRDAGPKCEGWSAAYAGRYIKLQRHFSSPQ